MRIFADSCDIPFSPCSVGVMGKPQRRKPVDNLNWKARADFNWSFSPHEHHNLQCSIKFSGFLFFNIK